MIRRIEARRLGRFTNKPARRRSAKSADFLAIDWERIPKTEFKGARGNGFQKMVEAGESRVRVVEYSAGYLADHWCELGHVVHVLAGEFVTEHKDGKKHRLTSGMSYYVATGRAAHRSFTKKGVTLLIVDKALP